jgi:hypothetical protein
MKTLPKPYWAQQRGKDSQFQKFLTVELKAIHSPLSQILQPSHRSFFDLLLCQFGVLFLLYHLLLLMVIYQDRYLC